MQGRRQDAPADRKHLARFGNGRLEAAGDIGQGRNEQIAKGMAVQPACAAKPVFEQLRDHLLIVRQSRQAIADVSRRQDSEALAESPRGAAIVCNGDNGRQPAGVDLQPAQKGRESVSATDRYDTRAALEQAEGCQLIHHCPPRPDERTQKWTVEAQDAIGNQPHPEPGKNEHPEYARQKTQGYIVQDRQQDVVGGLRPVNFEEQESQTHPQHGNAQ